MNTQKTYRFFTLLLVFITFTTALWAHGKSFEVFKNEALTKVDQLRTAPPVKRKSQQNKGKQNKNLYSLDKTSFKLKKQTVESLDAALPYLQANLSLNHTLQLLFCIAFPPLKHQIPAYQRPPTPLLPYFDNLFGHFIVTNAP